MITVTQFDIALFSIVVEQLVSMCTVCLLVREKEFVDVVEMDEITLSTCDPTASLCDKSNDRTDGRAPAARS